MTKVVFVATYAPNPRLRMGIRMFVRNNFDVKLIFAQRDYYTDDSTAISPVTCYKSKIKIKFNDGLFKRLYCSFKFFMEADEFVKREKPCILYVCGLEGLIMNYFGGWHRNSIIFYEVADLPGGRWRRNRLCRKIIFALEKAFVKRVHKIISASAYFNLGNYDESKTFVFENMPEKRIFAKYSKAKHENFVVGYLGIIRHKKSLEALLSALAGQNGVKVLIAGEGATDVYDDVVRLGLSFNNIEFKGHYVYENDIAPLYSSVDCVYSVYDAEDENTNLAMGNKLFEAMVCGLPIIVTKGSKMGDFVEANGIGLAVQYDDPAEIRGAVLKLMTDKDFLQDISGKCSLLREDYYYEKREAEFMKEIDECTNKCIKRKG